MSDPHVVLVVENASVPKDRRVWREALALRDAGFFVTVLCPREGGQPLSEELDGIEVRRWPSLPGRGPATMLAEYAWAMVAAAALLVRAEQRRRIDVLQVCNPPDTLFLLGLPFRLAGRPLVFDHHDLTPELFDAKYRRGRLVRPVLLLLERLSLRAASHVVVTNASFRRSALTRGRCRPEAVTVVRNGPDPAAMRRGPANPALRNGRRFLCAYVGVLGRQDGGAELVAVADAYVHELGRQDTLFALLGDGEMLQSLRADVARRGLQDHVVLPGWQRDDHLAAWLSTTDVGVCTEPHSALNDLSTLVKTAEYMAYSIPVLARDLHENRVTAGHAARYVSGDDPADFARALADLLDDPRERARLGAAGRRRVVDSLAWHHQARAYVEVFERLVGWAGPTSLDVAG